jgi:hypothetical protein
LICALSCALTIYAFGASPPPDEALIPSATIDPRVAEEMALDDAAKDGWPSEVLNSSSGRVLSKMFGAMNAGVDAERIGSLVIAAVRCSDLRPSHFDSVQTVGDVTIRRGGPSARVHEGPAEFVARIRALAAPFDRSLDLLKFKTVRSEVEGATGRTELIYLATGLGGDGVVQQNATWVCHWDVSAGAAEPKLAGIEVLRCEEVVRSAPFYADCTEAVFAKTQSFPQVRHGLEYWWGRLDFGFGGTLGGHYGLAVGDVDNDGLEDLYLCQPGLLVNRLYHHEPDGTLTDVTEGSGADLLDDTSAALFLDLDNDGAQDLVLATVSQILVLRGGGDGKFRIEFTHSSTMATSISSADYDLDGDLDLYVCEYAASGVANSTTGPLFDSEAGLPNMLLRNEGRFRFRDVTAEVGLDVRNTRQSFASGWADYDNDGDPDLYVANDFGRNNLYRNDGGRFVEVAAAAGVEDQAAGMGVAWGDYDGDGLLDLHVTNMFSSAGNRVTFNPDFAPTGGSAAASGLQYFSRGNSLFRNRGDGTFEDATLRAGIWMGRFAWGAGFVDLNNDGRLDILSPNGFITNKDSHDL